MSPDNAVSRRNVLRTTGGAFAGVGATGIGATGLAAAEPTDRVEVNVGFTASGGRDAALRAASEVVREFDSLDVVTIRLPKRAADALDARSDVRYVEENGRMEALAQTVPWGLDRIDAPEAHTCGYTGEGAHVAIIDTGIDDDHPDLQANLGEGKAFVECGSGGYFGNCDWSGNSNSCNYPWSDDNDHGTHCAGIAGAIDDTILGVAPDATLHAVKVLDCDGSGSYSDIAAGIEYVADQGWDVANLSLGGSASSTVETAVQYATSRGVLLVGAAGNDGPCTDCVGYPAAYPEVVAVSSTNDSDGLSSFSSQGPEVELAAPGSDIYSTVPSGYATFSGTSMAAPHVTGTGALLMGDKLDYSNDGARGRLCESAENVGLGDNESGCGVVNAASAVGC